MRARTFHTSLNLLIEPSAYQRLKMVATLLDTTMSKLIRDGIKLRIDQYDKENNSIQIKEDYKDECPSSEETRK